MSISFEIPGKRILSSAQLTAFQSSATYNTITSYIEVLNASVVGVRLTDVCSESLVRFLLKLHPYI
jgi:serine/threonine-protein phosphatase 2A activator